MHLKDDVPINLKLYLNRMIWGYRSNISNAGSMKSQYIKSEETFYMYFFNGGQGGLDAAEEFQEGRNRSIRTFYSPLHRSEPSLWNDTWSREAGCPRCTRALARGTPPMPRPQAPSSPHCTRRPHSHFQREEHLGVKDGSHHIISVLPVDKDHIWFSTRFAKQQCRCPPAPQYLS